MLRVSNNHKCKIQKGYLIVVSEEVFETNKMPLKNKFAEIDNEYKEYYKSFFLKGTFPLKTDGTRVWGYSIGSEIFDMFEKIGLQKYRHLLDLGSGDGKVVNIASLFTKADGIELDKELFDKSVEIKKKFRLSGAQFFNKDFLDHDYSKYDVIFIYPDRRILELEPKLIKEMKGILIFEGDYFHPINLKKVKEFKIKGNTFGVYRNY